jgi:bifunctional ADP-heptose synthase (sugar kinase/adenylyltransferase)
LDEEFVADLSSRAQRRVIEHLAQYAPTADVLVLSDYAKDVLAADVLRDAIERSHWLANPVVVDAHRRAHMASTAHGGRRCRGETWDYLRRGG